MPGRGVAFAVLLSATLLALAGCGDGGSSGGKQTTTASPAVTTEVTATVSATRTPADIRQADLTQEPALRSFLASSNGEVHPDEIIYADLTDDGRVDAVVPVSSGGEGGNIAVFVYGESPGGPNELLRVLPQDNTSLQAAVADATLTITEPVYATGDALCCPSALRTTTYAWDGAKLAVTDQRTEPATAN